MYFSAIRPILSDRVTYSIGVIYLTILNLPRKDRYKIENIILVSVIPGPKEPKLTLNPLLAPKVPELKYGYDNGWTVKVNEDLIGKVSITYLSMSKLC